MPSEARPAATVLLLRDRARELEVFMIERHKNIQFMGGALVFPGGRVNPEDDELMGAGGPDQYPDFAFRVAAIREAFEECGILLARDAASGVMIDEARRYDLAHYRKPIENSELSMAEFVHKEGLDLAVDHLVRFAHWITPEVETKRFDTVFYAAAAPDDHDAVHDGTESVDSLWITPAQALADGESGHRAVMFPTRLNIEKLGESGDVESALSAARASKIVTVQPWIEDGVLRIPVEAGYSVSEERIDRVFQKTPKKG